MKKQVTRHLRLLIIGWVALAILSCGPSGPGVSPTVAPGPGGGAEPVSQPGDGQVRQNLLRATVQVLALARSGGRLQPIWTGSGTIISPDGLILTNGHIVSDLDPAYRPDALGVAVTVRSDQLPELRYLAEVQAIDYQLDLAVIQIARDLDGRPIDPGQLALDYVALGDSDLLELGDVLQILGYPGIGGETITFTRGVVSGFTRERGVEGRAYIKTDATITGGNSGGLAANQDGQIIGVPTQVGYGGAERFADCRYLADTNGDNVIDQNDNCIPVGGFINALRPVNLARPLIEAARTGIAPRPAPGPAAPPSGEARFYNAVQQFPFWDCLPPICKYAGAENRTTDRRFGISPPK
jgi:serine protease Do